MATTQNRQVNSASSQTAPETETSEEALKRIKGRVKRLTYILDKKCLEHWSVTMELHGLGHSFGSLKNPEPHLFQNDYNLFRRKQTLLIGIYFCSPLVKRLKKEMKELEFKIKKGKEDKIKKNRGKEAQVTGEIVVGEAAGENEMELE